MSQKGQGEWRACFARDLTLRRLVVQMAKRERAVAENHGNEIHIQTSNREAKRISGRCYRGSQLPKSGGKMKRLLVLAITLAGLFYFPSPSAAGQGHVMFQSSGVIFKPAPRAGVTPNHPSIAAAIPFRPIPIHRFRSSRLTQALATCRLRSSSQRRIFVFYTTKLLSVGSA